MYTVSGSISAIERRNEILKNNRTISKTDGIIVGPYGTFIPKSVIFEYNNAESNLNKLRTVKNIVNVEKFNQHIKIMADITGRRMVADRANMLIIQHKNNID